MIVVGEAENYLGVIHEQNSHLYQFLGTFCSRITAIAQNRVLSRIDYHINVTRDLGGRCMCKKKNE